MLHEPPTDHGLEQDLERLGALAEPVRRALFVHVAEAGEPVTREAAAEAVGVTNALAAFHLERLLAEGLLETETSAIPGTKRGRGRPAKRYRLGDAAVALSIPRRRYDLAASMFTEALAAIDRPE